MFKLILDDFTFNKFVFRTRGSLLLSELLASSRIRHGGSPLSASHRKCILLSETECHIINNLLTELARAVQGNVGPRSWQYGPRANIPQYGPRARLVSGYYDASILGYSVVVYNNNNKYSIIKSQWGKNFSSVTTRNIYMSLYNHKNLIQFERKWAATLLLKLEILFKFLMFSGSRLYYFAPRKVKER